MFKLFVGLILAGEVSALLLLRSTAPLWALALIGAAVPATVVASLALRHRNPGRLLSPERIAGYRPRGGPGPSAGAPPEALSRSIVERATEIRKALSESPDEVRIEMCAIGYRACVNDMITLTHLTNEQSEHANLIQRLKLRRARKKATDALAAARELLPPGALSTTRQEL